LKDGERSRPVSGLSPDLMGSSTTRQGSPRLVRASARGQGFPGPASPPARARCPRELVVLPQAGEQARAPLEGLRAAPAPRRRERACFRELAVPLGDGGSFESPLSFGVQQPPTHRRGGFGHLERTSEIRFAGGGGGVTRGHAGIA